MKNLPVATFTLFAGLAIACSSSETTSTSSTSGQGAGPGSGGGSATTGSGGSGAGGNATSSGQGGSSPGAGGQAAGGALPVGSPQCATDQDCKLIDTCCDCAGIPSASDLPCNDTTCKASMCTMFPTQPVAAQCRAGQCVTTIDCDISKVMCKSLPPDCPDGQTNTVNPMTQCWGPCAEETECAEVAGCEQCVSTACVTYVTQLGPQRNCVDVPMECGTSEDCQCLGPAVCIAPYDTCAISPSGVMCQCPNW